MKGTIKTIAVAITLLAAIGVNYDRGESYCVLFPNNGRDVFGVAQRSIIVFDEGQVSLIPQVNFQGNAQDFGLFVPVPAQPELSTVGANVFTQASFLSQPAVRQSSGRGCEDNNDGGLIFNSDFEEATPGALVDQDAGGVTIIHEQIVGTFAATVLQAATAADLTQWLSDNNYQFDPSDEDVLEEYVSKQWFFVAMKLDTAQAPENVDVWWTATTSPVRITFEHDGQTLPYPLKLSAISTDKRADVLVYTIASERMTFDGATAEYANKVDNKEAAAIAVQYPEFATLMAPGLFITKLRRNFSRAEMQQDIRVAPSDENSEFRQITYVNNGGANIWAIAFFGLIALLARRRSMLRKAFPSLW